MRLGGALGNARHLGQHASLCTLFPRIAVLYSVLKIGARNSLLHQNHGVNPLRHIPLRWNGLGSLSAQGQLPWADLQRGTRHRDETVEEVVLQ